MRYAVCGKGKNKRKSIQIAVLGPAIELKFTNPDFNEV